MRDRFCATFVSISRILASHSPLHRFLDRSMHIVAASLPRAMSTTPPLPTALVYNGPGAGARSVASAIESLRAAFQPTVTVETIGTEALLHSPWWDGCTLLVMPGGADLPYCKHLNGRGTALIREFVESGGAYLGLCAGAYFGCARVEFEPGTPLEVVGPRELAFFPGIARGSVYPGFEYEGEGGAVAAPIQYTPIRTATGDASRTCRYETQSCVDYVNGGPQFLAPDATPLVVPRSSGTADTSLGQHAPQHAAVEVLASYPDMDHAAAAVLCRVGLGRAVLCGSHPELDPGWLGRPAGSGRSDCEAGSTPAVPRHGRRGISSTEATRATAGLLVEQEKGLSESEMHVDRVRTALEAGQAARWRYWCELLAAAGLEAWLQERDHAT